MLFSFLSFFLLKVSSTSISIWFKFSTIVTNSSLLLADYVHLTDKNESNEVKSKAFIQAIRDLNTYFNIPEKIEMKDEDIPVLAKRADKEGNPLYPVPKLMNAKELEQIYYLVKK